MYKISDKGIKFIREATKNWIVELKAGRKTLVEVKIQRGIFQGDVLSQLPFVIAMKLLSSILKKCTRGLQIYKMTRKF